jgi:hypothetical protein
VYVGALQILDELQFQTLGIGEFADGRRDGTLPRELRSAESPGCCDQLE